jgi:hypothetical protein
VRKTYQRELKKKARKGGGNGNFIEIEAQGNAVILADARAWGLGLGVLV